MNYQDIIESISTYIKDNPDTLKYIQDNLPDLKNLFSKEKEDVLKKLPKEYFEDGEELLSRMDYYLTKLDEAKQNNKNEDLSKYIWLIDGCKVELQQYSAIVTLNTSEKIKEILKIAAVIAIKITLSSVLPTCLIP